MYIVYALLKFIEFFFRSEQAKMKDLEAIYVRSDSGVVKTFDMIILVFMLVLLALLFTSSVECLSFTTGFACRDDDHSIYFHKFSDP